MIVAGEMQDVKPQGFVGTPAGEQEVVGTRRVPLALIEEHAAIGGFLPFLPKVGVT
jgi:hypothetical protein